MERIQKILARGGIASRRHAEQLITEGRVRVNGRVVTELGTKADPRKDRVEVDGKRVVAEQHVYVVLHKPRGVVATMSDPEGRPTVRELLASVGGRVFPVGRLDFATSGVLLATNDGELADGLLHPRKAVPKTYVVKVKGKMTAEDIDRWRKGVRLEDGMTLPADGKLLRYEGDKTWFELTIKEGRNQQIRRMGEATRFPVMRLARVMFAEITAEGLRPGQWRHLTREELVALKKAYGVPRAIPAPPASTAASARRARKPPARTEPRPDARSSKSSGHPSKAQPQTVGPRYGGGAPGRRSYETTEDWGGGARRGSSGGRFARDDARSERPYPELGGGRGGRTRTTGTSGGPATTRGGDRVKTRRG
ncbi:MAG: rRNA pseudouridine synthase [Labilithrix sp.]|nr:rRNA pseudouridine synthase [Labilithrix sp.]